MGLDTVEIVMEIENHFDISIPDSRASDMTTVGEVYDFILERLASSSKLSTTCLSAAVFYELRRQLRSLGISVSGLRPSSAIESFVPRSIRRATWETLADQMKLSMPLLQRPTWLAVTNLIVVLVAAFLTFGMFPQAGIIAPIAGGCVVGLLMILITECYATEPNLDEATVRDWVTSVVAHNHEKLTVRYSRLSATDVWNSLQCIIAEQLGVQKSAVVPSARFIHDLGAD